MKNRATQSYEYNTICDVCGFKFKASELKQRWDGPMVCPEDWETRNILDFYRQRNDTHKLPFVRTDNQVEKTWTPIFTNLSGSVDSSPGTYVVINNTVTFRVQIIPVTGQTTSTISGEVTLPTTPGVSGTVRAFDKQGRFLGTGTALAGNTTCTLPNWTANSNIINISGTYGV